MYKQVLGLWKAVVHPKQFYIEYRTNVGNLCTFIVQIKYKTLLQNTVSVKSSKSRI